MERKAQVVFVLILLLLLFIIFHSKFPRRTESMRQFTVIMDNMTTSFQKRTINS
jgi:hypothetical protein